MCKDLFCIELKKKHFLVKWTVTYKIEKSVFEDGHILCIDKYTNYWNFKSCQPLDLPRFEISITYHWVRNKIIYISIFNWLGKRMRVNYSYQFTCLHLVDRYSCQEEGSQSRCGIFLCFLLSIDIKFIKKKNDCN